MTDYRRVGFAWLRPLIKFMTRLRYNDLHPMPFTAIPLVADGKLGLWHGAPTVIIILKDIRGVASPDLDCGIAGQNMVLAAHSMGLGTCWVGFAKLALDYEPHMEKAPGHLVPVQVRKQPGHRMAPGESRRNGHPADPRRRLVRERHRKNNQLKRRTSHGNNSVFLTDFVSPPTTTHSRWSSASWKSTWKNVPGAAFVRGPARRKRLTW